MVRLLYLMFVRMAGLMALLAHSAAAKDAEIRAPRTQLEGAMQKVVSLVVVLHW